ncbi:MAG: 4-hydroxy-3-methylbut-2-enyl diphosphate reductase, partial [Candidatus Dadabacteria bacterium]
MAREFNIPSYYLSDQISLIKHIRKEADHRKKDFSPTEIDLGAVSFKIARFFGFCFGVQNAIEIAYRAISENPGKRIFLLSEMIHNFYVNEDLQKKGVRFLRTTEGEQLIDFAELTSDDIVIIPAFGTTPELLDKLKSRGIDPCLYNTTCPFVEKVWKRAHQLGQSGYTVVVHGKYNHEETRATFSHAKRDAPTIIIRD